MDTLVPTRQSTDYYCGPACAQMILAKYGINVEQQELAAAMRTNGSGTNTRDLVRVLRSYPVQVSHAKNVSMEVLMASLRAGSSVIQLLSVYGCSHYVCLVGESRRNYYYADPETEFGWGYVSKKDHSRQWCDRFGIIVSSRRVDTDTVPVELIPEK